MQIMKDTYTKDEVRTICWRFIAGVLVIVVIWLFTSHTNEGFVERFSFAATLSSIILSVLAIFMSISGEARTQSIRERIEKEADAIEQATLEMKNEVSGLSEKMNRVESKIELTKGKDESQLITSTSFNKFTGDIRIRP